MQARSRVSLADEATVDTGRLIGCNGHSQHRVLSSPAPSLTSSLSKFLAS